MVSPAASEPSFGRPYAPSFTVVDALHRVVADGGSDLHITAGVPPMMRLHGSLRPIDDAPVWTSDDVLREIRTLLTPAQREQFESTHELDFAYPLSPGARFRANIYQQRGTAGAVFRFIPTKIKSLAELGMPRAIQRFAEMPRGLVLVTGPTGSGKSTTLAALIDQINKTRADHIMTIEDPIEFLHPHQRSIVNQREVGHDTASFQVALRQVLRQDPDVILIGEMRDLETISVALTAAETGHLVFGTLHTQSAPQTIDRIIDVFPPHQQQQVRTQLAATLRGVVCQTLVPDASGTGRVAATEVLVMTPAVANLIREEQMHQIPGVLQAGSIHGMHTLDQNLAELVDAGRITYEAAQERAQDKDGFRQLARRSTSGGAAEPDYGDLYSRRSRRQ
ncbi:type IV pilus twitching motility protein PilT [Microbacterium sp. NPDC096154]|uniref:type IV pilus twitching motility protein PilT n=1 Tax=Microbacterium sp. NPDC096154 TaxID=3155549 RepID=UPI003332748B